MKLPDVLPRTPEGFTQRQAEEREGILVCTIHAPDGSELPITYRYKPGQRHDYEFRGYQLRGSTDVFKTWGELAAAWPAWVATVAADSVAKEHRRGA
jgi:hypothetical protein